MVQKTIYKDKAYLGFFLQVTNVMELQTSDSKQYVYLKFCSSRINKKQIRRNQDMKKKNEQPHLQTLKTRSDFITSIV